MKFKVVESDSGNYRITGTSCYKLIINNKYDAKKHCEFLNKLANGEE